VTKKTETQRATKNVGDQAKELKIKRSRKREAKMKIKWAILHETHRVLSGERVITINVKKENKI